MKELRQNHVLPLISQLNGIAQYNAQEKEFTFPNGSRIFLGYCSAESDVLQYQGQAYDVIFLEEATQFTEFQFQTLTESNRASGNMKQKFTPRMYFTCNPGGVGHAWVKRLFIDREYRNKENPDNYDFIPSTVYDNQFIISNNPEYVENLENLPEMRKRAMLYGDWDAFDGQYFDEFNRDIHVVDPFPIPDHWDRYTAKDYGLDMLANLWIAVDTEGNAFVYKELYESNLIVSEASKRIREVNGNDKIKGKYAPPDLDNRQKDTGKSIMDLFHENDEILWKSDNSRVDGWLSVKEWLKVIETKDLETGELIKTSRLKIFKNCTNLIRTLPLLQCDEKDPNDCATEPHEITHAPDALRYFCIMRRYPAEMPQSKAVKWRPDQFEDYYSASKEEREYLIKLWGRPQEI